MKKISELSGQPLQWVQPGALRMEYELHAGNEVAATLRFRSAFGTFATGESADGCWTFKRIGFWQTRATVRACGASTDLAIFHNNTWSGGGTLKLADGRKYRVTSNGWETKLDILDASGSVLVRLKIGGLLRLSATVEIQPASFQLPELPWLVMLGCYLTVMMQMDSAAAAGAASAAASG